MDMSSKVILLASGGIDSTALLDFYLRKKANVQCIHFQYGQPNAHSEKNAFRKICKHYGVTNRIIKLNIRMAKRKDEILCRNTIFAFITSSLGISSARIALGIHAGSNYYDCTKSFINDCQHILDGYYSGTVRLEAPFINFTKYDIFEYCKLYNIPVELTYSCLRKNFPPCGKCPSCIDRKKLYEH